MKPLLTPLCGALFALILVCLAPSILLAQSPGTAFVYQGLLVNDDGAISDTCDFTFALFDAPTAGAEVTASLNRADVVVTEGLFGVALDFGGVFTGAQRWLQVTAQCSDDPSPVTLLPRQELTPTPYAIYAASAGTAAQATNAATATNAINATNAANATNAINATHAVSATNAVTATYAISAATAGAVEWGGILNKPDWQCAAGEVLQAVNGDGTKSCVPSSGGSEGDPLSWHLAGNTGSAGNFLGTTNDFDLEMRVNNVTAQRYLYGADSAMTEDIDTVVTPHVVGGSATNVVSDGQEGSAIGGGGSANAGGSYNVIGGGFANSTSNDVSTVGGGKSNNASGEGATIAGGFENTAQNIYDAVGGGVGNDASGGSSTISGGFENNATAAQSVVGGGRLNTASGIASTVAGGWGNTASGSRAAVGGGESNQSSASHSAVAGGKLNTANGDYSFVGSGESNTADGIRSVIGGGTGNRTIGVNSAIPGGAYARTDNYGQLAFGSGGFLTNPSIPSSPQILGSAQSSIYVLRNRTTNGTPQELYLDGSSERISVRIGSLVALDAVVVAAEESSIGLFEAYFTIRAFVESTPSGIDVYYASIVPLHNPFGWDVDLTTEGHDMTITVTGAGMIVRWVARIETTEILR